MWFKLLLLLLYLLLLFIFSRVLEVVSWCNGTTSLFPNSRNLLDPVALSVKKLKQLLDNRGVNYSWAVEKKELIQLVEASGTPAEEEVELSEVTTHQTTYFSCGSHFYEEVEDTKDSIWLVQVVAGSDDDTIVDETTWKEVISQVAKFGVRTGVFRCSLDKRLCSRKLWTSPRLILALPQGTEAKQDVFLHNYLQSSKTVSIVNWVRGLLTSRIKNVNSVEKLSRRWLTYNKLLKKSEIRLVLFSTLAVPPLFLSSLAIKFNGRVKFATVYVEKKDIATYKKLYGGLELPTYLVITPEQVFEYGKRVGENFSYNDMEFFLKSLHPEMNDVFLWSLLLINAVVGFELFLTSGKLWKRFIICLMCIIKYNCLLFLMWLFVLTLYQFSFMTTVTDMSLKLTRIINGTNAATILRNDWKNIWSYHGLILVYIMFGSIVGWILRKIGKVTVVDDIAFFSDYWSLPWCNFITSCFFRPMVTLTRPLTSQELDLEEGMELLIERMAVPNLWLQPMISSDYIKDLPIWKYRGWCDADDNDIGKSDVTSSSEDEITISSETPELDSSNTVSKCSNVNSVDHESRTVNQRLPDCFLNRNISPSSQKCEDASTCDNLPACVPSPKSPDCSRQSYSSVLSGSSFRSCELVKEKPSACDIKRAPIGMLEFRECSICIESYRYGETLCGLPCGHNYHINCIMAWLYRDNHCCPICRRPSYKSKYRSIHLHSQ